MDKLNEKSHQTFLHETLWNFAKDSCLTDITFICQDLALSAHRAILSAVCRNLFMTYPGLDLNIEQSMVFLPDWTANQVEEALNSLYVHRNSSDLEKIHGRDDNRNVVLIPLQETDVLDIENNASDEQFGCLDDFLTEAERENIEDGILKVDQLYPAICPWCAKQFKGKESMEVHEKKVHLGEDLKKVCAVSKMKEHLIRKLGHQTYNRSQMSSM